MTLLSLTFFNLLISSFSGSYLKIFPSIANLGLPSHFSSLYSRMAFNLVLGQVTIQASLTTIYNEAFNHPCTEATGCVNKYSSLSLLAKLI